MPQNIRSGLQGEQQTPPVSLRRSRRSHASRASYREGDSKRGGKSSEKKLGHTSAAFLPLENPPEGSGVEQETSLAPISTRCPDGSSPLKQHDAVKGPIGITPPTLVFQGARQTMPQQTERGTQPGYVRIIHYDHSKYRPSTPGSEKHPIKIEDSPNASLLLPTGPRSVPVSQELAAPHVSHPDISATYDDFQPGDTGRMQKGRASGSLFITPPADLVLSAAATSIISSPKAAMAFLHCFLEAEEYWLRSCDHDMDPDIKFLCLEVSKILLNDAQDGNN
ncbi:hypothetical protein O1611_g9689 [Lasiodiplodia mahajangana]|uniref:Uncharacterized protein n=1 Tax=Lasiodiplodia mahajangana TaxID=1108764 RepID=A0ACC2J6K8_9PEZI|nr:hypothetical protein O1611_g9689 [Lasiodiplodia mahajangana]